MKFVCSVTIQAPRDRVVAPGQDPDHLDEWQDGFLGLEPVTGQPGSAGSKTKLMYKTGKRKITLLETIVTNDLPDWFIGTYETEAMTNTMINHFTAVDEHHTRWDAEIEYTRIGALIPRILAVLVPGMFRKQTQKWLDQFKVFAEDRSSPFRPRSTPSEM
tara:strand:+ start:153 stop:632 length:480 start_codon:yes stop_codon:yes gene_type:complete